MFTYFIATSIHVLCRSLVALIVLRVGLRAGMIRSSKLHIRLA
jgi:hypothetical protein